MTFCTPFSPFPVLPPPLTEDRLLLYLHAWRGSFGQLAIALALVTTATHLGCVDQIAVACLSLAADASVKVPGHKALGPLPAALDLQRRLDLACAGHIPGADAKPEPTPTPAQGQTQAQAQGQVKQAGGRSQAGAVRAAKQLIRTALAQVCAR